MTSDNKIKEVSRLKQQISELEKQLMALKEESKNWEASKARITDQIEDRNKEIQSLRKLIKRIHKGEK